jgi:hypothetical protein
MDKIAFYKNLGMDASNLINNKIKPQCRPIAVKIKIPDFSLELKEAIRLTSIECRRKAVKRFNQDHH